ncbi:MAG TPA: hypothetical protein PK668_15355 [Myxococcota bacterium]|nr:hypothetical protein [Myxococcota bacterium]HRY94273.1 hypothetical protein [Myxococcota bacterium]HSA21406.1 hypothetical protein [Myxococcota bacterium]
MAKTTGNGDEGRPALEEVHPHHDEHLCELTARRKLAQVARASRGARFLCHVCGRAAAEQRSLCEPVEI